MKLRTYRSSIRSLKDELQAHRSTKDLMLGQNSVAISHAAQTITVLVYVHADLKRAIKVGLVEGLVCGLVYGLV